jgi:DNA-binding NarL/FixJ family response regulator
VALPLKVFLVEDLAHLQIAIRDLLLALGDITLAGSATTEAEANLWVSENPGAWDVAIVDLMLDQGSGMSVIRNCRRASADATVLVFSEYVTPGIRQHCLALGADEAISKTDVPAFMKYCSGLSAAHERRQPPRP